MKPIIVKMNEKEIVEISFKELKKMLDDVYYQGRTDANALYHGYWHWWEAPSYKLVGCSPSSKETYNVETCASDGDDATTKFCNPNW